MYKNRQKESKFSCSVAGSLTQSVVSDVHPLSFLNSLDVPCSFYFYPSEEWGNMVYSKLKIENTQNVLDFKFGLTKCWTKNDIKIYT